MLQGADFHWFPLDNPGLISIPLAFFLGWLGNVTDEQADPEVRRDGGPVDRVPGRERPSRPLTALSWPPRTGRPGGVPLCIPPDTSAARHLHLLKGLA